MECISRGPYQSVREREAEANRVRAKSSRKNCETNHHREQLLLLAGETGPAENRQEQDADAYCPKGLLRPHGSFQLARENTFRNIDGFQRTRERHRTEIA